MNADERIYTFFIRSASVCAVRCSVRGALESCFYIRSGIHVDKLTGYTHVEHKEDSLESCSYIRSVIHVDKTV